MMRATVGKIDIISKSINLQYYRTLYYSKLVILCYSITLQIYSHILTSRLFCIANNHVCLFT